MRVPDDFANELKSRFNGRFRLRWSDKRREFHLEQKVGMQQILPPPSDPETGAYDTYDDTWRRASDGYFYVMTIRTGDRMPCPVCGSTVAVPIMETRESHCDTCVRNGLDGRYVAAFYPLNHVLLEHLSEIDPLNGGPKRARDRVRARQIDRNARMLKEGLDNAEFQVIEDKIQLDKQPMVGYGPKSADRAPTW